jgi:hypothetical protein
MGQRLKAKPDEVSFLIVLTVKSEEGLLRAKQYLDCNNITNYMFFEPDYEMGYTAICSEPVYGEDRKLFKKFKLWKHS